MRTSQLIVIWVLLLVGYIATTALNRPSSAQPPAPQPVGHELAVWRCQLNAASGGAFSGAIILTDTATGWCWIRSGLQGPIGKTLDRPLIGNRQEGHDSRNSMDAPRLPGWFGSGAGARRR
jgi:hypothetical protein